MNTQTPWGLSTIATLLILTATFCSGETPLDLTSGFDTDTENWRASDAGATLAWQASGGASGAYLEAQGPGTEWHLLSPSGWAGDWSGYRALKFDMAITSRHYADEDRGDMVVIVGANSDTMTWNGPTPLWTWTHFEVSLNPESFGVDQATFDGIMADVSEMRILAEFTTETTETLGLDNVRITATPIHVHSADLIERFTNATVDPDNGSVAGWLPVDDVTFYVEDEGRPSRCLHGDDWQDGRYFKIASPPEWAGDWRAFTELSFDLLQTRGDGLDETLVLIFGANGEVLEWKTDLLKNEWQHHSIPLAPASFGVDQATFDGVMAYVNKIWIRGEFDSGDDQAYLDNVVLSTTSLVPKQFETSLVSRFGADEEGWIPLNNCSLTWNASGGFTGGYVSSVDLGSGSARFQSPDSWAGDWSNFGEVRLFLKTFGKNRGDIDAELWIVTWDGTALSITFPPPYRSWSPYTLDLQPDTFGVSQAEFDAIISNVACLWVRTDLVNGTGATDTNGVDEISVITSSSVLAPPPDHFSDFMTGDEGWRGDGWTGSVWDFSTTPAEYIADGGNPDGCVAQDDVAKTAFWFSPESWAGDWRGYESVAFDIKIINGSAGNLLEPGWMLSIVSSHGNLDQSCVEVPIPQQWKHYEFALTPQAFGVSQEEFDLKMRDVIALAIRSEWINYSEKEGLDNVRLSKAPEAYWLWLAGYLDPSELGDESIAGKLADADHDRFTNWDEFLALTVPTDPLSRFVMLVEPHGPGGFVIRYQSRNERVYQVWKSVNPEDPASWAPVGPMVPGDEMLKTYTDPATDPRAFFRVGVDLL